MAVNLDGARTRSSARGSYEEYHPHGSTAWWAGASSTVSQKRYRFTGMERDDETGLQCHGVRYYAVWLGRWVSADPIGLGDGVSRYLYCHSDPLSAIDKTGLIPSMAPHENGVAGHPPYVLGEKIEPPPAFQNPSGAPPPNGPFANPHLKVIDQSVPGVSVTLPGNLSPKRKTEIEALPADAAATGPATQVDIRTVRRGTSDTYDLYFDVVFSGGFTVEYAQDPVTGSSSYGAGGGNLGKHEEGPEGHIPFKQKMMTSDAVTQLLGGTLSVKDPVTGQVLQFQGIDLPTSVTLSTPAQVQAWPAAALKMSEAVRDHIMRVQGFAENMVVHGPRGPGEFRMALQRRFSHFPTAVPGQYRILVEGVPVAPDLSKMLP